MGQVELTNLVPVFLAVLGLLGLGVAAMAIGVIFRRPSLRGSCGGPAIQTRQGEKISCATCPNRDKPRHEHGADCKRAH